jgi:pimeloyl-ACP methyl ester carboxylesterase
VSFDRLGYDRSGQPNGVQTCIGAQADVTNQIVDQLRSGEYAAEGASPAFDQVVLAGQSNGGLISNLAAISFDNVDGLAVHGWGDLGFTAEADARFIAATGRCLLQMAPNAEPGVGAGAATGDLADIPFGYTYYDNGTEEFLTGNFADAEPAVLEAVTPLQNAHPCGDMTTITPGIYQDLNRLDEVDVPVQVVYGSADARIQGIDVQVSLYSGAPSVDTVLVPDSGHYMGLERNATLVHDEVAAWLTENGLV